MRNIFLFFGKFPENFQKFSGKFPKKYFSGKTTSLGRNDYSWRQCRSAAELGVMVRIGRIEVFGRLAAVHWFPLSGDRNEALRMWTELLQYLARHFDVVLRNVQCAHCIDLVEAFANELLQLAFRQQATPRRILLVCLLALAESSLWRRRRRDLDQCRRATATAAAAADGDRRGFFVHRLDRTGQLPTAAHHQRHWTQIPLKLKTTFL